MKRKLIHLTLLALALMSAASMEAVELWGFVSNGNSGGAMYSFQSNNPTSWERMFTTNRIFTPNAGSWVKDGKLFFGFLTQTSINPTIFVYDYNAGNLLKVNTNNSSSVIATETCQDLATGTVYGQFYSEDMGSKEWGTIDFNYVNDGVLTEYMVKNAKRTTLAPCKTNHLFVALGITKEGTVYGIEKDGNLYRIDIHTGDETLVGSTGVTVVDSHGGYARQSGEIDQQTNTFYWAYTDATLTTTLYTVDLQTGAATKIATLPQRIYALTVAPPLAEADAPNKPQNLTPSFTNESVKGQVSFTAPTTTYGGDALTGTLNYQLAANGTVVATGTTTPGATVTVETEVEEGEVQFSATCSNAAGNGPKCSVITWVGYDLPADVNRLTARLDATQTHVALSWAAPTSGIHGGYLNTAGLTYDVVRIKNGQKETVGAGLTETTFSDTTDPSQFNAYTYIIYTHNGNRISNGTSTQRIECGAPYEVPYFATFETAEDFGRYSVINANADAYTWNYYNHYAVYQCSSLNPNDDWLITPPIHLKKDHRYTFSTMIASYFSGYHERFEVRMGTMPDLMGLTTTVIEPTEITSGTPTAHEHAFDITADGNYYFAIRANSDIGGFGLVVGEVSIETVPGAAAPAAVGQLQAVAGAEGALQCAISFNMPTQTIGGTTLAGSLNAMVMRNGKTLRTFTNLTPGQAVSFTDSEGLTNSTYTYSVLPYMGDEQGQRSNVNVYVGVGIPDMPTNTHIADNGTTITYSWNTADNKNAAGQYIDPSEVEYVITKLDARGVITNEEVARVKAKGTVTIDFNTDEGDMKMLAYGLMAENAAGRSIPIALSLPVGKAVKLPFAESFTDGYTTQFWSTSSSNGDQWYMNTTNSADDDGGSVGITIAQPGHMAAFASGKISLAGAANPKLVFNYATSAARKNATIQVRIRKPDGNETTIETIDIRRLTSNKWQYANLPLSSFSNERYIIVRFIVADNDGGVPIYLDNIRVLNVPTKDMAISMTASKKVEKGQKATAQVTVENTGDTTVDSYEVRFYADEELIATEKGSSIEPFHTAHFSFDALASAMNPYDEMELQAEVVATGDAYSRNNSALNIVQLTESPVPAPENLRQQGNLLSWEAPSTTDLPTLESFENYDSWATAFTPWTLVDGDPGYTAIVSQSAVYPSQYKQLAYTIFCPDDFFPHADEAIPCLKPHTGQKYAATPYQIDNATGLGNRVAANDWLISPLLADKEQTISFWAKNGYVTSNNLGTPTNTQYPETFDVLYSTVDNDTANFVKLGSTYTVDKGEWTEVSINLPVGTRHFAIRHNTPANNRMGYIFMIDDISFVATTGEPTAYRIYRDEQLVATITPGSGLTYTDGDATGGNHSYAVTALYADGRESAPVSATPAGIADMRYEPTATSRYFNLAGQRVEHPSKGLYITGGRKVIVR